MADSTSAQESASLPNSHTSATIWPFSEARVVQTGNHQGLDNKLIDPKPNVGEANGEIECHERLGGVLRYYYRHTA